MQKTVDNFLVHELVDNIFCKPVGGLDEEEVVGFINVVFVLEDRDLQFVLCRRADIAIDEITKCQAAKRYYE
jgi:hypothetical protein